MTGTSRNLTLSDETLNAYVDGALDSGEAALVARICASDPRIARRVAILHQLKAGVAGLGNDVVFIDPAPALRPVQPGRRLGFGLAGLAAACMLAVSVLWAGDLRKDVASVTGHDAISGLIVQHDAWSRALAVQKETPPTTEWLTGLLSTTGLALAHHATLLAPDGSATQHFAFVGPNGCKLSLFDGQDSGASSSKLDLEITDVLLRASWTHDRRGYTLVARSMDRTRFVATASALHEISRQRAIPDEQLLAGLRQARQPCIG